MIEILKRSPIYLTKSRTPKEIKNEIRDLKQQMSRDGLRVTSMMNRQGSIEEARANERLFALKIELERAEAESSNSASKEKIMAFVRSQGIDPQYMNSKSVMDEVARRFNSANRTNLTGDEIRRIVNS